MTVLFTNNLRQVPKHEILLGKFKYCICQTFLKYWYTTCKGFQTFSFYLGNNIYSTEFHYTFNCRQSLVQSISPKQKPIVHTRTECRRGLIPLQWWEEMVSQLNGTLFVVCLRFCILGHQWNSFAEALLFLPVFFFVFYFFFFLQQHNTSWPRSSNFDITALATTDAPIILRTFIHQ